MMRDERHARCCLMEAEELHMGDDNKDNNEPIEHHSKLKGAVVGAVVGHAMGHHALAGAAVGALAQHERNKHPR